MRRTPSGISRRCGDGARSPRPSPTAGTHRRPRSVYRSDIYLQAAKLLVAEGKAKKEDFPWDSDGYRAPTAEFIDEVEYDGRKPNEYLSKPPIGLKGEQRVAGSTVVAN